MARKIKERKIKNPTITIIGEGATERFYFTHLKRLNGYKYTCKPRNFTEQTAGATIAAIPNGDKNGKKCSVMNHFIAEMGLTELLKDAELDTDSSNLEDIYSELDSRSECQDIKIALENKIVTNFIITNFIVTNFIVTNFIVTNFIVTNFSQFELP